WRGGSFALEGAAMKRWAAMVGVMLLGLTAGWAWGQDADKGGKDKVPAAKAAQGKEGEEKKPAEPEAPYQQGAGAPPKTDGGDTAWLLVSPAPVMVMVPGLALFYGGMARRKNILGTMMHSMVALSLIGIQWVLFGYCLAFGKTHGGWIGWDWDLV